jgi:fructoselysine 6-kinase
MARLLGLGDNTIDTYVSAGLQFPGGNAVNVAVLSRRLGAETAYLGCLGDDEGGAILEAALREEGVDLSHVRRLAGPNARARIAHDRGDRRFIGSNPGVRGRYDLSAADFEYIATHDLVHTSCNSDLDAGLARIAAAARRMSYDYSEKWADEHLDATLAHVAIAFLSAPRLAVEDCEALARRCAARGPSTVVVTRGTAGAVGLADGRVIRQVALTTQVVDTLGAGDGFIAGFLVARLDGAELPAALARGAEMAARVCTWQGAFGHACPWSTTPHQD